MTHNYEEILWSIDFLHEITLKEQKFKYFCRYNNKISQFIIQILEINRKYKE